MKQWNIIQPLRKPTVNTHNLDVSPKQNALQKERDSNVHTQWFYLNETVKEGSLICSPIKHISSWIDPVG